MSVAVGNTGGRDKLCGCGKTSVGEKEWKADVDEVANGNDDLTDEIGRKVTLTSVEHEDIGEERDKSENTLKLMMAVGNGKYDIFDKLTSSGSSMFAKSSTK